MVEKELEAMGEAIHILRKRLHVNVQSVAHYASMGPTTYEKYVKGAMAA